MPSQPVWLYQGNFRGGGKDMHGNDERKRNKSFRQLKQQNQHRFKATQTTESTQVQGNSDNRINTGSRQLRQQNQHRFKATQTTESTQV